MARRKKNQLSASTRFEVFKRDGFKCQYCGAEAPQVLLHVDHIKPSSKGGGGDMTNLITSCSTCNMGKGARPLDDSSALQKSRRQMEELQARREQLDMMMRWREGLLDIGHDTAIKIRDYWVRLAPGFIANEKGIAAIKSWIVKFTLSDLIDAMDTATAYLVYEKDGSVTIDSWARAFEMIPKIANINRQVKDKPEIRDIAMIKGALRKRFPDQYKPWVMDSLIDQAKNNGYNLDTLKQLAWDVSSFYQFTKFCQDD